MATLRRKADGRYYIDYLLDGTRCRVPIKDPRTNKATRDEAFATHFFERWHNEVFLPAQDNRNASPLEVHTINQLCDWFVKSYLPGRVKQSSITFYKTHLERLRTWAKLVSLTTPESLTAGNVDAFRAFLVTQGYASTTISLTLKAIAYMLRSAIELERIPPLNLKHWPKVKGVRIERPILTEAQLSKFIETARSMPLGDAMVFQALTGMRTSDVCNIKWGDINGDMLTLRQVKTGGPLERKLSAHLLALINRQPKVGIWVFCSHTGEQVAMRNYYNHFRRVVWAAGLPSTVCPKMLRHTFGTMLARERINWQVISQLMGHADPRTTFSAYQHASVEDKSEVTDWFESRILRSE